jgi:hypothetical protein
MAVVDIILSVGVFPLDIYRLPNRTLRSSHGIWHKTCFDYREGGMDCPGSGFQAQKESVMQYFQKYRRDAERHRPHGRQYMATLAAARGKSLPLESLPRNRPWK